MGRYSTKVTDDEGNTTWEASDGESYKTKAGAYKHSKSIEIYGAAGATVKNQYSDEEREEVIRLLLDGQTVDEISENSGINKNTIIWWRTNHKRKTGTEFPTHHRRGPQPGKMAGKAGFKYYDQEIIDLIKLNPGFGIDRFVKVLYPTGKKSAELRYRTTMMLNEHHSETGEDLYDLLQDPDFSTLVSENEWKKITGKTRVPQGVGRAAGGRASKTSKSYGKGRVQRGSWKNILLPPQEFNWGEIIPAAERPRHKGENNQQGEEGA